VRKHAGESDTMRRRSGSKDPTAPRVNPAACCHRGTRGGSYRSAWNRSGGARGRQRASSPGFVSVKAPPADRVCGKVRGVSIQGAARRRRAGKLTRGSGGSHAKPDEEGAPMRGRTKRARANSKRSPFSSQAARTALARSRGLPLRTKMRGKSVERRERRKTPRSP